MTRRLLIACAFALTIAAPAHAEPVEVTSQAKATRATFLLSSQVPRTAAAVCLVDTGVNDTPDTVGLVARFAFEGDAKDTSPTLHGTQMAMFIAAPRNGYGMVGLWPTARIVSVRANVTGQDVFTPARYVQAMKRCDEVADTYGVRVILLAFSSNVPLTAEEREELRDTVIAIRAHGLSVIAAAGNTDGAAPGVPASEPGILSVAASDGAFGGVCAFSATGAALVAPGCALDGADPSGGQATISAQGTSYAAAIVAGGVAALRTWRPDLAADAIDQLVRSTAKDGQLDLTAAFTAAGFPPPTETGTEPSDVPTPTSTPTANSTPSPTPTPSDLRSALPRPQVRVKARRQGTRLRLLITARNRPHSARMKVEAFAPVKGRVRRVQTQTRATSTITLRVRTWRRVRVTYIDPSGARRPSPAMVIRR
jgi:hypothetical protein